MSAALQTVHVRVNDGTTGKPTPCRIRFTDADGNYFAPIGRLTRFPTGSNQAVGGNVDVNGAAHAYIDGTCEIALPAGAVRVEISKGPEYRPIRNTVQRTAGKLALRFTLGRWIDMRGQGWYSGDTRALFLSPHAALLEGQAEDLAVVNLLAAQIDHEFAVGCPMAAYSNLLAFSGPEFALAVHGHGVAVNTLNHHPILGALALLNCHRVVFPLTFGGPRANDDWTLADWCQQCHRKGGLVVWTRAADRQGSRYGFGEALADLVLGHVDAFELDLCDDSVGCPLPDWSCLLSAGVKTTLVGASAKVGNGRALGATRTYAQLALDTAYTYRAWIDAVRAGRTFATNGPLVTLTANGAAPSRTPLELDADATVRVQAEARSWLPFDVLRVRCNGAILRSANAGDGPPFQAALDFSQRFDSAGWLTAECVGEARIADGASDQRVLASTSPVYLAGTLGAHSAHAGAVRHLLGCLDLGRQWVQYEARCTNDRDRERLLRVFQAAQQDLQARLRT